MAQKYKVFIDQHILSITSDAIFFKQSKSTDNHVSIHGFLMNLKPWILENDVVVLSTNPKKDFKKLKEHFKFIKASGGLVEHRGKFLFIKRLGKWDLPKGKMDPGETPKITALREIEEECNLHGHQVVKKICNTYHTYPLKDRYVLKKTFWFLLKVPDRTELNLKPQTEEGITELRWFAPDEWSEIRENTYASIIDVFDTYQNMILL
jgi:8-oxo-dGTP pyrophosphatase MutT (NUDIX family)